MSSYQVILLEAFSSDAIPLHLLTRESLRLYLDKLKDSGILLFHISNRYLNLAPILKRLGDDAGLICRVREGPMTIRISSAFSNGDAPHAKAMVTT